MITEPGQQLARQEVHALDDHAPALRQQPTRYRPSALAQRYPWVHSLPTPSRSSGRSAHTSRVIAPRIRALAEKKPAAALRSVPITD